MTIIGHWIILFLEVITSIFFVEGCWAIWVKKKVPWMYQLMIGKKKVEGKSLASQDVIMFGLFFIVLASFSIFGLIYWFVNIGK